jgi:hypothetical protein
MTNTTDTPLALTSSEIDNRIAAERQRLLAEQNLEADLTNQRLAPLEAGDDEALDRVEANLNACRDRQFRIQERIGLLESRLAATREHEAAEELATLRRRAIKAARMGEAVIRERYAPQAAAMAQTLARLAALDRFVHETNRQLEQAGQEPVPDSNNFRHVPGRTIEETERRMVGCGNSLHPAYGKVVADGGGEMVTAKDGARYPRFMEMDVTTSRFTPTIFVAKITEAVELPAPLRDDEDHPPGMLWDKKRLSMIDSSDVAAVLAEIDAAPDDPDPTPPASPSSAAKRGGVISRRAPETSGAAS